MTRCGFRRPCASSNSLTSRAGLVARHEDRLDERAVGEPQAVLALPSADSSRRTISGRRSGASARAARAARPAAPSSRRSRAAPRPVQRVEDLAPAVAREVPTSTANASQRGRREAEGIATAGIASESSPDGGRVRGRGATRRRAPTRARRRGGHCAARATLRVGSMPSDFRKRRSLTLMRNAARRIRRRPRRSRRRRASRAATGRGPPAVHADLRVEDHVEVVALVADLLDRVVDAARAGDRFVDRLAELLEHRAEVVVQFHVRGDYRSPVSKSVKDVSHAKLVLSFRPPRNRRACARDPLHPVRR